MKSVPDMLKNETVVRDEPAMWIKDEDNTQTGKLVLTNKRILFIKNDNILVDIDLDTINSIDQHTYVVDTNVLSITYLQYETVKISVIKYEDWERDIESTRMHPDIL